MNTLIASAVMAVNMINFTGTVIDTNAPKTIQVKTVDSATVTGTPLLSYMYNYTNSPVKEETITYE